MAAKQPSKEIVALTEKKMDMSLDDIVRMSKTNNTGMNKQQRVSNKSRGVFNGNQDRSLRVRQYMNTRSTFRQEEFAQNRSNFQGKNFPLHAERAQRTVVTTSHSRPINNRNAGNWNKPRLGGQPKYQGNAFSGGNSLKLQQHQQQQHRQHQHQNQQRQHQHQSQNQQRQHPHQNQQRQHQSQNQQPQHPHQQALPREESMPIKKPKTLDSLFASMKEQRLRSFNAHPNNGSSNARVGFAFNQPRQPWLRGRFASYNN